VRELTSMLRPYMDLMAWDIRAISENKYDQTIQEIRDALSQMRNADIAARATPVEAGA
jgi:hypothetical protein